MSKKERRFLALILIFIFVFIATDLVADSSEGSPVWHLMAEGFVAAAALYGVFRVLKGSFELKHSLNFSATSKTFRLEKQNAIGDIIPRPVGRL